MGSRLRENPEKLFEVFVEIARPDSQNTDPFVLQKFPETYDDEEVLKSLPKFAFPCLYEGSAVDHFTFVLTDIEGKLKFGFCRHATGAQTCLCIISCLPWYSIFYKYLNMLAEIINRSDTTNLLPMLRGLHREKLPSPGYEIVVISPDFHEKFSAVVPDPEKLPSIPENRNLTEYYNAVDANNMMTIFASMLHERRILITSRKLSRLTACAHAAAELIYPMHWQHLFIPVLPTHLVDYCSAPMPYIIGVHVSIMQKIRRTELGDAVILDADDNKISSPYNDVESIPSEVMSTLKRRLRGHQSERIRSNLMGDGVSKAFLTAICHVIGYYREGLKLREGEKMVFDRDQFIQSRPPHMQPFLEQMVQLQIFEQFVNDRLEKLNSGTWPSDEFEKEVMVVQEKTPSSEWMYQMKKQTRNLKKVGREGRDRLAELTSKVKDRSKKVAREFKSKIDDSFRKEEEEEEAAGKKTNLEHRKTITSAAVKSQRDTTDGAEQPPRPPPPNRRSGGQRSSYDRTLQYQVLDVDNMVETESAPRTTDDINFPRVSLDLMNDPDIRNIYQQSYSMEDLTALDEKEDTDEALISTTSSGSSLTGSADLLSMDQPFVAGKPSVSGALDTTAPTPPPRLKKLSANIPHSVSDQSLQSSSSASGSEDPAFVPQIINQSFLVGASDSTATNPSNSQAARPTPTPRTSLHKPDLLINLGADTSPDDVIFDPLLAGSGAIGDTSYGSSSGASRQPVMRKPAVRNGANRPSVAQRNSQIIATDAQSIRDARSNFIATGGARPPVLDPFDQLVPVAAPMNQTMPSPAKEQIAVSPAGDEENLLKEWNLNFGKLKIDPGSPRPFTVPQGTSPNGTRNSGYPMGSPMHRPVSRASANQMSSPYAYQPRFQSPLANQRAAGRPATNTMTPHRPPTNQAPSIQVNLTIPAKPINRVGSAPACISSQQGTTKNTSNIDLLSELDPLANKNKQSFGKS